MLVLTQAIQGIEKNLLNDIKGDILIIDPLIDKKEDLVEVLVVNRFKVCRVFLCLFN